MSAIPGRGALQLLFRLIQPFDQLLLVGLSYCWLDICNIPQSMA